MGLVTGVLLLAILGGAAAFLIMRDDDKAADDGDKSSDDSSATADPSLEPADVSEQFASLGAEVADDMESCQTGTPSGDVTDEVRCQGDGVELVLRTYADAEAARAAQDDEVTYVVGSRFSNQRSGLLYAEAEERRAPTLFWNNYAEFQSAKLTADSKSAPLDDLVKLLKDSGSEVTWPTGVEDRVLRRFVNKWTDVDACVRVDTMYPNLLETSQCKLDNGDSIFASKAAGPRPFKEYRRATVASAREEGGLVTNWRWGRGPYVGQLADFHVDKTAVRYWDHTLGQAWMEYYGIDGDAEAVATWWETQ